MDGIVHDVLIHIGAHIDPPLWMSLALFEPICTTSNPVGYSPSWHFLMRGAVLPSSLRIHA